LPPLPHHRLGGDGSVALAADMRKNLFDSLLVALLLSGAFVTVMELVHP
jgi:hypothetical protein